jgi:hypothetical protein
LTKPEWDLAAFDFQSSICDSHFSIRIPGCCLSSLPCCNLKDSGESLSSLWNCSTGRHRFLPAMQCAADSGCRSGVLGASSSEFGPGIGLADLPVFDIVAGHPN